KTVDEMPIGRLSQQVQRQLDQGQSYRFVNLVRAAPEGKLDPFAPRRLADNLVLVEQGGNRHLVALAPGDSTLPGLATDAEIVLLTPDRLMACGLRRLAVGEQSIEASAPIALEISADGSGSVDAPAAAELKISVRSGASARPAAQSAGSDAQGPVAIQLPAGRSPLHIAIDFQSCWSQAQALTTAPAADRHAQSEPTSARRPVSQWDGFPPIPEPLTVRSVTSSVAPRSTYGPIERLADGKYSGSTNSVMWPAGASPVITLALKEQTQVTRVVLREWHFGDTNEIAVRKLELSSDGFDKDVRPVTGAFADAGREAFGNNVNTLMALEVGQPARQLRLSLAPARKDGTIYLAEAQVFGTLAGRSVPIRALAAGRFGNDRRLALVVCGESGRVTALDADAKPLWTYATPDAAPVNALACADVDGKGGDEVLFGGASARLGLLDGDGRLRWEAEPPRYRGIASDVVNVLPADITGDGRPELVAGCRSWQYFAYDPAGKMLWQNLIYAHSASVACADDLDGDRKAEVIAGNVYYTLNAISSDGKRRWLGGSIGPEITAVASWRVPGEKSPRVVAGVDGGTLHVYDAAGKMLWEVHLGDRVTRILACDVDGDGGPELVCAAESAHLFALRADGRILWRTPLPDGSSDLVELPGKTGPRFAAAAGSAGLCLVDASGKILDTLATPGRAHLLALVGTRLAASTEEGRIAWFNLAQ
ncbi:MAG: hypothetical protein ACYC6Y_06640, partial [Thermoguttaceae bacterium]